MARFKTVACAISGGVDSCVAALMLKRRGYNICGVFMRNWDVADETGFCQSDSDREDAAYICRKLGIDFHEINFVKDYWNKVFSDLIQDYQNGFTPNPDILCNKMIKFDSFLKYAKTHLNVDAIATGHYARIDTMGKHLRLLKGMDENKDQTFFLSQVSADALRQTLFPLGMMTKDVVKKIAFMSGFHKIASKKESMGICFVGRRRFQDFIHDYVEPSMGKFINVENRQVVGHHKGIHCWTIGQRCAIPGKHSAFYVVERNYLTQEIIVAPGQHHPALYHQNIITDKPHWINNVPNNLFQKNMPFECDFRFQHRNPVIRCLLYSDEKNRLHVLLRKPLRALTPGQFAVFYQDEECLGSAQILCRGPSLYDLKLAECTV